MGLVLHDVSRLVGLFVILNMALNVRESGCRFYLSVPFLRSFVKMSTDDLLNKQLQLP